MKQKPDMMALYPESDWMRWLVLLAFAVLAACDVATTASPGAARPQSSAPQLSEQEARSRAGIAARQFVSVVETVEPVAERECRMMAPRANCDFQIVVDSRPNLPPNAFQTLAKDGRPVIGFTQALIADAQNADELA